MVDVMLVARVFIMCSRNNENTRFALRRVLTWSVLLCKETKLSKKKKKKKSMRRKREPAGNSRWPTIMDKWC